LAREQAGAGLQAFDTHQVASLVDQLGDPFTVGIETFEAGDDAIDARLAHP
jgi:hypothetical protein